MEFDSHEVMLLTGAGFSSNFGCPLAKEMWAWIFNNKKLQNHQSLRNLMLGEFDFEKIVTKVRTDEKYLSLEKEAMEDAVKDAYTMLDKIIINYNWGPGSSYPVNLYKLQEFLLKFSGYRKGTKGFIFTLNQDLFLERHMATLKRPQLLGINHNSDWFTGKFKEPLQEKDYCYFLSGEELNSKIADQLKYGNFFYVKLHGSQNWLSNRGIVIGTDKAKQMEEEPFNQYLGIFKGALFQKGRKLLVIGYGFKDEHINKAIFEAIQFYNLRVYVISPDSPDKLRDTLKDQYNYGTAIWEDGIVGYFPFYLKQIFTADQTDTEEFKMIQNSVFA